MQCDRNDGKMEHFTNYRFAFAEGEFLYIPNDFSRINGWFVSQFGVLEVCLISSLFSYLKISVVHGMICSLIGIRSIFTRQSLAFYLHTSYVIILYLL